MTDPSDAIQAKLQQAHAASHHTAGTVMSERSARADLETEPSHDAIRQKAYECWEARGRIYGRDKEDWFEALEALRRPALPDGAPIADIEEPSSDLLTAGIRAAGSMIIGAARTLDEFLGLSGPKRDEP